MKFRVNSNLLPVLKNVLTPISSNPDQFVYRDLHVLELAERAEVLQADVVDGQAGQVQRVQLGQPAEQVDRQTIHRVVL